VFPEKTWLTNLVSSRRLGTMTVVRVWGFSPSGGSGTWPYTRVGTTSLGKKKRLTWVLGITGEKDSRVGRHRFASDLVFPKDKGRKFSSRGGTGKKRVKGRTQYRLHIPEKEVKNITSRQRVSMDWFIFVEAHRRNRTLNVTRGIKPRGALSNGKKRIIFIRGEKEMGPKKMKSRGSFPPRFPVEETRSKLDIEEN